MADDSGAGTRAREAPPHSARDTAHTYTARMYTVDTARETERDTRRPRGPSRARPANWIHVHVTNGMEKYAMLAHGKNVS